MKSAILSGCEAAKRFIFCFTYLFGDMLAILISTYLHPINSQYVSIRKTSEPGVSLVLEEKQHDLLEKFKAAHPEMDFSKAKWQLLCLTTKPLRYAKRLHHSRLILDTSLVLFLSLSIHTS